MHETPIRSRLPIALCIGAVLLACGPDSGSDPTAPHVIASVEITGAPAYLVIGEEVQLSAIVRDAQQQPLTGVTISWSSSDGSVASVGNGRVAATGVGEATITASAGGKQTSVDLSVSADVHLVPNASAPYGRIEVRGIEPVAKNIARVQVGGEAAGLVQESEGAHSFLVPYLPAGRVEVLFSAADGALLGRDTLEVEAVAFIGGSAEATLQIVDIGIGRLAAAAGSAIAAIDLAEGEDLVEGLTLLAEIADSLIADHARMSSAEREAFAAFYAEAEDALGMMQELATVLEVAASMAQSAPGSTPAYGFVTAAASADPNLSNRCEAHLDRMLQTEHLVAFADKAGTLIGYVSYLGPIAGSVAKLLSATSMAAKAYSLYLTSLPVLFEPNGLLLSANPPIVEPGESGVLSATVRLTSAGDYNGTVVDLAMSRVRFFQNEYKGLDGILVQIVENFWSADVAASVTRFLNATLGPHPLRFNTTGRPVFSQIVLIQGEDPETWLFTGSGMASSERAFLVRPEAVGEPVVLAAQFGRLPGAGAAPGCQADTDPAATGLLIGHNGFGIGESAAPQVNSIVRQPARNAAEGRADYLPPTTFVRGGGHRIILDGRRLAQVERITASDPRVRIIFTPTEASDDTLHVGVVSTPVWGSADDIEFRDMTAEAPIDGVLLMLHTPEDAVEVPIPLSFVVGPPPDATFTISNGVTGVKQGSWTFVETRYSLTHTVGAWAMTDLSSNGPCPNHPPPEPPRVTIDASGTSHTEYDLWLCGAEPHMEIRIGQKLVTSDGHFWKSAEFALPITSP